MNYKKHATAPTLPEQASFWQRFSLKKLGLGVRILAPCLVMFLAVWLTSSYFTYVIARDQFNSQISESLKSGAQFTRSLFAYNWNYAHTRPDHSLAERRIFVQGSFTDKMSLYAFSPGSGVIIASADLKHVLGAYPDSTALPNIADYPAIAAYTDSSWRTIPLNGGGVMVASYFTPIDAYIIAFDRSDFANASLRQYMLRQAAYYLPPALFITFMLVAIALYFSAIAPLHRLMFVIQNITRDSRFDKHVKPDGAHEFRALADAFNTLIDHIDKRDRALNAHNLRLEELIDARTKALKEAQKKLVQQEKLAAVGEFSSSIAHELRNPLSSIKMGLEKIPLGEDEKSNKRLQLMRQEVVRLENMLSGILSFTASPSLVLTRTTAQAMLTQWLPILEGVAHNKNIRLVVNGKDMNAAVMTDTNRVLQALINLVKNACEASAEGSTVSLDIHATRKTLHLAVRNTGAPIPDEIMARLFEPFYTTKSSGTGLGLPTTKRLLEEIEASLSVKSNAQEGTVFTLQLPLAREA